MKDTLIAFSHRLYQRLLRFYPPAFRADYQQPMAQLFRDQCRDVIGRHGWRGFLNVWGRALPDFFLSSIQQHLNHWISMKNVSSVSLSVLGVGLLAGAATFVFHSSAAVLSLLAYLCAGLLCLYAALAVVRSETPWWKELVAAVIIFLALGVFMPWWAKAGQELNIRLVSAVLMAPLVANLAMLLIKGIAQLWPRAAH